MNSSKEKPTHVIATAGKSRGRVSEMRESQVSETLYGRRNVFREMGLLGIPRKLGKIGGGVVGNRWSDCGCESCVSWTSNGDQRLHVVRESSRGIIKANLICSCCNYFILLVFLIYNLIQQYIVSLSLSLSLSLSPYSTPRLTHLSLCLPSMSVFLGIANSWLDKKDREKNKK